MLVSDLMTEELLAFAEATKVVPGHPHVSTLHRWRLRGIHGKKLETCLIGGRRYTSREALERFSVAVTAAAAGEVRRAARPPVASETFSGPRRRWAS